MEIFYTRKDAIYILGVKVRGKAYKKQLIKITWTLNVQVIFIRICV